MANLKKCDICGKIDVTWKFREITFEGIYSTNHTLDFCEKCFKELKKFLKLEDEN